MRRARLRHEIALVLAAKAVALGLLYVAFFAPSHELHVTPAAVSQRLLIAGDERTER